MQAGDRPDVREDPSRTSRRLPCVKWESAELGGASAAVPSGILAGDSRYGCCGS